MSLNITIASLGRGHHIECRDLTEMLEAEDTVRSACKDLTRYLDVAATFDGAETVIEYVNGEERLHVMQSAPPLLDYAKPFPEGSVRTAGDHSDDSGQAYDLPPSTAMPPIYEFLEPLWLQFETFMIDFAKDLGLKASPMMVRAFTAGAVLLFLYALYKIF